jgi:Saxitoxin biosynthesis operon protein SxtJ
VTNDKYFGSHEIQSREETIKSSSDRSFGIVFAVFFALVAAISWYHHGGHWHWWLGGAVLFALVALTYPRLLAPLNWLWTKFGLLLASVVSPVVLGLVFYLCITPIGFLMRLFGKDPMRLKLEPEAETYWIPREPPGPPPESLKNQF